MIKNYSLLFLFFLFGINGCLFGQEIKIFNVKDFDLKGNVKTCLVSTDYGKEEYEFNIEGLLVKSVTRYSDADYDKTYYKYTHGELKEKRLENYRDGEFFSATSIANFYEIDTSLNRKITEKIMSYDKEFLDQYEYLYTKDGKLEQVIRTNNKGIDETRISYDSIKKEEIKTFFLNGVILESIRTSQKQAKDKSVQKVVLTKKFLKGDPNTALEKIFDDKGNLVFETKFKFDQKKKQFTAEEDITYYYDTAQTLSRKMIKTGKITRVKDYIYQFDANEVGNWVKQIITPENTYITRKITYFESHKESKEVKE